MTKNEQARIDCQEIAKNNGYELRNECGKRVEIIYDGKQILSAYSWTRIKKLLEAHQYLVLNSDFTTETDIMMLMMNTPEPLRAVEKVIESAKIEKC